MDTEGKQTLKDLRYQVEERIKTKIGSNKALRESLAMLFEFEGALKGLQGLLKICTKLQKELSDACAKYAANTLSDDPNDIVSGENGVLENFTTREHDTWSGDVFTPDGRRFHLVRGIGKVCRIDGDNITQTVLANLPDDWVDSKLELAQGEIKRTATPDELAQYGLRFVYADKWTETTTAE